MPDDLATEESPVTLIVHAPEHGGRRPHLPALAGACCCSCCCCCLHTVGGIVGAIAAPRMGDPAKDSWLRVRARARARARAHARHLSRLAEWDQETHPRGLPDPATTNENAITKDVPAARTQSTDSPRADANDDDIALPWRPVSAETLFWWTLLALVPVVFFGRFFYTHRADDAVATVGAAVFYGLPALQLVAAAVVAVILAFSSRPDRRHQLRQLGMLALGVVAGSSFGFAIMLGLVFPEEAGLFPWLIGCLFIACGAWIGVVLLSRQH